MALKPFSSQRLSTRRFNPLNATPTPLNEPYFPYTTLLLSGNGTNGAQNNTFLDGSTNNFTITRNGNTTQGTFSPFSQTGWGNYFAGSQSISIAATAALQYSGDFTIECWFYKPATGDATTFIQQSTNYFALNVNPGTGINIYLNSASANFVITDRVPQINTWHHIALVRSGSGSGNIKCYLDGVASSTTATNTSTLGYNAIGYLGAIGTSAGGSLVGYVSNLRIVSGRAVYTSNFTPPALPLTRTTGGTNPPQGSETIWLTAQSNRFLDSNGVNTPASSPLTITANGSPTVVAFSPFNPTASWSAATYGGSGYFDGSGDYLSVADNAAFQLGTNSFCIEGWFFPTTTGDGALIGKWATTAATAAWNIVRISGTLYCQVAYGSSAINASTTDWPLNQWSHIAFVRSGNTLSAYLNGTRFYTNASFSSAVNTGVNGVTVATQSGGTSYPFTGYLSGFRVVNGTAVYDPTQSTITVPTAPLTAITNTSLLLNFTNAGIYDATSKNDLETVGNAQISTAQYKFPPSSMAFDGTGDWLIAPPSQNLSLGAGDFTIETWVYPIAYSGSSVYPVLIANGSGDATSTSEFSFYLNHPVGSTIIYFNTSGTTQSLSGGSAVSTGTWSHVAISRSSGTLRVFINGTQRYSGACTASFGVATNQTTIGVRTGNTAQTSFNGYIQDLRITKGYARYTANFTAPTAPFPTF